MRKNRQVIGEIDQCEHGQWGCSRFDPRKTE